MEERTNSLTDGCRTMHLSMMLGAMALLGAGELRAAKRASVIQCGECSAAVPNPDEATYRALSREKSRLTPKKNNAWALANSIRPGDTMTVCNGIVCADYTWRGGETFDSGDVISTVLPRPARGGGGRGGGGGGGSPIGGGGGGGGGGRGKVTVGDVQQM
jgi:uncharacterized membrane protein YgcG